MTSLVFIILAAIFNACMDILGKYDESIFKKCCPSLENFMNPKVSWKNKYKNLDKAQGPKFFGSTTFLVWTTDFWHLCKTIMIMFFSLSIVFYSPIFYTIADFFIYFFSFGIVFELFYSKLLKAQK
jgi:hypothetical protein